MSHNQGMHYIRYVRTYRSSHPEVFCKKGVLKNFAKFKRKRLCQGLFKNIFKFLRTPYFIEHLWWLLLHLNTMAQKRKQLQEQLEESSQFYLVFVEALTTLLIHKINLRFVKSELGYIKYALNHRNKIRTYYSSML